jgi:hypothetical protein
MSALDVVEALIQVGTTLKDAWNDAKQSDPSMDWTKFITSSEFTAAYASIEPVLDGLTQPAVTQALTEIRARQATLLAGNSVMSLSSARLAQYDALLDVENQLMRKYAANATKTSDWVSWIVDDALPDLFKVISIAVPLL